ncbi:MAG: twin-arginine translocase subunit TatC [Chitinophagaceae bacterium]
MAINCLFTRRNSIPFAHLFTSTLSLLDTFLKKRQTNATADMHFTDHIEELRWHIVRSLVAIIASGVVVWLNIEWIFDNVLLGPAKADFISYRLLCRLGQELKINGLCVQDLKIKFQNTELAGQFTMSFSVSFMIGLILAFPYVFWEFWRFIRPALKEKELKHASGIVFWSSLLFISGVMFAYFIIVPFTVNFFGNYQLSPSFQNIITIGSYYDTMADLVLGMGCVFEIPILVYFLAKVGILTPALMRSPAPYGHPDHLRRCGSDHSARLVQYLDGGAAADTCSMRLGSSSPAGW